MKKFFGTDGIRDRANSSKLNGNTLMLLGMALGDYFRDGEHRHRVVIGKDTRLSGYMIEQAVTAGLLSMGMDVFLLGPIPTPGVSLVTKSMRADIGIMITASHNKFHDNGLKIFDKFGNKLSDKVEMEIENLMNKEIEKKLAKPELIGRAKRLEDANARYIEFVKNTFPKRKSLEGLKVVIDCANGASYISAPTILYELGAEVVKIGVNPDGFNINKECGSTDTSMLVHTVLKEKADIGFALDGDGDRLIVCDENGKIVDGDQILGLLALSMKAENNLREDTVVATDMSNLGLEKKLNERSIKLLRTSVGDRYIKEEILKNNLSLGGEQSGHIIMTDYGSSGDGMVTALKILSILNDSKEVSSKVLDVFKPVPQKLLNFNISDGKVLEKKETKTLIESYKQELSSDGRIFERMSGTEPVLRVMIECNNQEKLDHIGKQISSYFSKFN